MPIVAAIGGNAGTQTMAVAVRALAVNQLTRSNTWRTIWREIRLALLNGVTIAILIGLGAGFVFFNAALGGVLAAALLINLAVADLRSEDHTSELPSLMLISYASFCLQTKKCKTKI